VQERNRQSAKRSRAKRQAYIGKLEVELQQLQQENRILKALVSRFLPLPAALVWRAAVSLFLALGIDFVDHGKGQEKLQRS